MGTMSLGSLDSFAKYVVYSTMGEASFYIKFDVILTGAKLSLQFTVGLQFVF